MSFFRIIWLLHRWLGAAVGFILVVSAVSGFLLLKKKQHAWIQPPIVPGVAGSPTELKPLAEVYQAVFALGVPQLQSEADIAKIDFRPAQRVHKVVSRHDDIEVQVCATTLRTSGPQVRRSDWLERLHDGSLFGELAHGVLMPAVAVILFGLSISGYIMWLWPKYKRWRKRTRRRQPAVTG